MIVLDDLDKKALEHFRGFVVKKDLLGIIKGGANVPAFVLEYLLANTCSTEDEDKLKEGLENVKTILRDHYVNPEESTLIQSKLREKGRYKIIDKISVTLYPKNDRYWAHIFNSNIKNANISDDLIKQHEKLLLGGIWAIIDMEYDALITIGNSTYPFVVKNIKPIQLSSFNNSKIIEKRKEFTKEEWKKLLLRSAGYEPESEGLDERKQNLLLCRLIPLVENNFNMVELGPRSSGKSYIYKEITPYAILISGGQGTVAQLFVNNTTGRVGAVGLWDAICFDESTDKLFKDHDAIPLMKDYMESGSFSRAKGGEITGSASIILKISGLIKLLHPDGIFTKSDIKEYLEIALEMRRRVKEQLKRIGGMEFWDTNFSYIDKETQEEVFIGLPEERGSGIIESSPLPPGVCYTATSDGDNTSLIKIEVVAIKGSGKVNVTGTNSSAVKEDIKNTVNYIKANERSILTEQHSLSGIDLNIQVSNLIGAKIASGIGSALYVAIISSIYKKNLKPAMAILGNISIGGAIERANNFADKVTMLSENGAQSVLSPIDNLSEISTIPSTVLGKTDVPFYANTKILLQKAIFSD